MIKTEIDGGVRPRDAPDGALCRRCNYPLRGLQSGRCPECGQEFNPGNPETMNLGAPVGWVERFFAAPPGILLNGLVVSAAAFSMVRASGPGGYYVYSLELMLAWMGLVAIWVIRLLVATGIFSVRGPARWLRRGAIRRWLVVPIVTAITFGLCSSGSIEWLAYRVSRPAMDRLVGQWATNPAELPKLDWIGLYPVHRMEAVPDGVRFLVHGTGQESWWLNCVGFAYFQSGAPPAGECCYKRLEDHWFRWTNPPY